MLRNRRLLMVFGYLLVFMMVASACTMAAPVDTERAQTLNIAVSRPFSDPTSFNIYAPGFDRSRTGLGALVHEYLFYLNMETGEYIPWLAESYEYNDDFTEIT